MYSERLFRRPKKKTFREEIKAFSPLFYWKWIWAMSISRKSKFLWLKSPWNMWQNRPIKLPCVRFSNCTEDQVNGDSTRTKKLKLHIKWLPGFPSEFYNLDLQFVSPTGQFILQKFFSSLLLRTIYLFSHPRPLALIFLFYPSPPSLC